MMEPRRASSQIDKIRRRTIDSVYRSIALILDGIERRDALCERAVRQALCTKAACRRAGGCRGSRFTRACEARPRPRPG